MSAGCSSASSLDEPQHDWPTGFHAQYALVSLLGAGSYGKVWSARNRVTGESCAVKVVPKTRRGCTRAQNMKCVDREVQIWKDCQTSEYVCKFEGAFQDDESVYLVQELCHGGDLRSVLADGPLSEVQVAEIMRAVLDVIATCHRKHYAFGDVKPANFLLKEKLARSDHVARCDHKDACHTCIAGVEVPAVSVRATDFGCSQSDRECLERRRRMGSPVYMAPELWGQRYGLEVDLWAAGVMMYQLLSGRYPFWDQAPQEIDALNMPMYQVMMAVSSNPIHMSSPPWDKISWQAKDLIRAMLDRSVTTRITATQALKHPWFLRALGYTPAGSSAEPPRTHLDIRMESIRRLDTITSGEIVKLPFGGLGGGRCSGELAASYGMERMGSGELPPSLGTVFGMDAGSNWNFGFGAQGGQSGAGAASQMQQHAGRGRPR